MWFASTKSNSGFFSFFSLPSLPSLRACSASPCGLFNQPNYALGQRPRVGTLSQTCFYFQNASRTRHGHLDLRPGYFFFSLFNTPTVHSTTSTETGGRRFGSNHLLRCRDCGRPIWTMGSHGRHPTGHVLCSRQLLEYFGHQSSLRR